MNHESTNFDPNYQNKSMFEWTYNDWLTEIGGYEEDIDNEPEFDYFDFEDFEFNF